jgi:pimeloyl-ACP methyl ester carboxylesterase
MFRRGYVDGGWGQIHLRQAGNGPAPTLVCLHATAYSSRSLTPLLPPLACGRRVIALDTPGYGSSDGPDAPVALERYADAIAEALRALAPGDAVDLFGYHTGAMIAAELAVSHPVLVRRLVLIGVPYFEGAAKAEWRARLVHPTTLGPTLDQFADRWAFLVARRAAGFSLARGFDNFADELLAYPREWYAHHALFDYDAGPRLQRVHQPALIINPDSPLAAASRHAASLMANAEVLERPDLRGAILDNATAELACLIDGFLRTPTSTGSG